MVIFIICLTYIETKDYVTNSNKSEQNYAFEAVHCKASRDLYVRRNWGIDM